jgi:hypothetical protein
MDCGCGLRTGRTCRKHCRIILTTPAIEVTKDGLD